MQLLARQGEMHAHLFENPQTDLARDLYWSISVELEPIEFIGEVWESGFQCEWLTWSIKEIRDLDGMGLDQLRHPELVEASLYLVAQHHWVTVKHLRVRRASGSIYQLDAIGAVDIEIDGQALRGPFRLQCNLNFDGIIVVPENLLPRPSNPADVAAAVGQFISLAGFEGPRIDRFRYVLRPTAC